MRSVIIIVVIASSLLVNSCGLFKGGGNHQDCPAYGQNQTENQEDGSEVRV